MATDQKKVDAYQGVIASNLATKMLAAEDGIISLLSTNFFSDAVGTLKFFRYDKKTTLDSAESASDTIDLKTDAAGDIGKHTPVAGDFLAVPVVGGVLEYHALDSVGAVSAGVRTFNLAGAASVTVAAGETVYLCRAAEVMSRATTDDERVIDGRDLANSKEFFPLYIEVSATGTNELSGTYEVLRQRG